MPLSFIPPIIPIGEVKKMPEEKKGLDLGKIFGAVTDFILPILQKTTTQAVAQIPAVKRAGEEVAVQRTKDILWDILPIAGVGLIALLIIRKF